MSINPDNELANLTMGRNPDGKRIGFRPVDENPLFDHEALIPKLVPLGKGILQENDSFIMAVGYLGSDSGGYDVIKFNPKLRRVALLDGVGMEEKEDSGEERRQFEKEAQQLLEDFDEFSVKRAWAVAEFDEENNTLKYVSRAGVSIILFSFNTESSKYEPFVVNFGQDGPHPKVETGEITLNKGNYLLCFISDGGISLMVQRYFVEALMNQNFKSDAVRLENEICSGRGNDDDLLVVLEPMINRLNQLVELGLPLQYFDRRHIVDDNKFAVFQRRILQEFGNSLLFDDASFVISPICVK